MSKGKFFCFNVASCTLFEDPSGFYCYRRYKFAIETLLCNTQLLLLYMYIAYLSNTVFLLQRLVFPTLTIIFISTSM